MRVVMTDAHELAGAALSLTQTVRAAVTVPDGDTACNLHDSVTSAQCTLSTLFRCLCDERARELVDAPTHTVTATACGWM
jgi:hypothetical protein